MQAYSEDYLFDAMEVLGEAFDCAANRVNLGLDQFFEMFVATGVADAFGAGAPRGAPLKSWREQRGLSQVALAEKSGVSLRAIQQYEQRCKDINHGQGASLYRLAQTLGCRIEDLLEYPL